jgi:hypothetical protein
VGPSCSTHARHAAAIVAAAAGIRGVLAIDAFEPRLSVLAAGKGPFFTAVPLCRDGAITAHAFLILGTTERTLARKAHKSLLAAYESCGAIQATGSILWRGARLAFLAVGATVQR